MALTKVGPAGIGSTPGIGITIGNSFLHTTGLESTNANFSGIVTAQTFRVLGNFQVDGTTTTLDTEITSVDKLEVEANNTTVAVAITQSGSGDILNLYDGSNEVFSIADGGKVTGVGSITAASFHGDGSQLTGIDATQIQTGNTSVQTVDTGSNGHVKINTEGSERLRITSDGNIGIGINDPNRPFVVRSGNGGTHSQAVASFNLGDNSTFGSGILGVKNAGNRGNRGHANGSPLLNCEFSDGTGLILDKDGNIGIGTANPVGNLEVRDTKANLIVAKDGLTVKSNSDLATQYDLIQLGAGGVLASYSTATATADTQFIHNAYRHSGGQWKYRYADTAMRFRMNSPGNTFIFESAASGNADANITFTERFRITSDGKFGFGNSGGFSETTMAEFTSSVGSGALGANITIRNTATDSVNNVAELRLKTDHGVARFYKYNTASTVIQSHANGASDLLLYADGASNLKLHTNAAERLRITSDGDVGIGDNAPNSSYGTNLSVHSTTTDGARIKISDGTSGKGNVDGLDIIHQSGIAYFIQRESNDMRFYTASAERLRITSAGDVKIGSGNPSFSAGGGLHVESGTQANIRVTETGNTGVEIQQRSGGSGILNVIDNANLLLQTNNIERVRITAAGLVLIGKNSGSFALDIERASANTIRISNSGESTHGDVDAKIVAGGSYYQNMAMDASSFKFSTYNGSSVGERLRITSAGQVLVGTTSAEDSAIIQSNGVSPASFYRASGSGGPNVSLKRSRGNLPTVYTVVQNNDNLGAINFAGTDGSAYVEGAKIFAEVDGIPGSNDMPTRLIFATTADGASSTTERLRIDANGAVTVSTTGYSDQYSYSMKLGQGTYANNDSTSPHYGLWVRQNGPRYALNYGIFSEVVGDIGYYGGVTIDGLSSVRGIGIYGTVETSATAYQKGIGVYGKATNTNNNYNTSIGVRGRAEVGTTTFSANNGQKNYGGHFVSTGKADCVGVYADAYLDGSPGAGQEAIPLLVSSNGTEKLRVDATQNALILSQNNALTLKYNTSTQKDLSYAATRYIYISDSGDDSTGDGSSSSPWRTMSKALASVPKFLIWNCMVIIKGSSFTDGTGSNTLQGICGPGIIIITSESGVVTYNKTKQLVVYDCHARIEFQNIAFVCPVGGTGFALERNRYIDFKSGCTYEFQGQAGWSWQAGVYALNNDRIIVSCNTTCTSSSTSGLGGVWLFDNCRSVSFSGDLTKSGSQFNNHGIAATNGTWIYLTGDVTNFVRGFVLGVNHYGNETRADGVVQSSTFTNCGTGIKLYHGSLLKNYGSSFSNTTTNIDSSGGVLY